MNSLCAVCGQPEEDHHEFVPIKWPAGCVCDNQTWGNPAEVPSVCDSYKGDGVSYCSKCEHDEACHARAGEGTDSTGD